MTFGHAMMAVPGLMALRACRNLAPARPLVQASGPVPAALAAARAYAAIVGSRSGATPMRRLGVEGELAGRFPGWLSPAAP